jgi:hypothetical protein
MVAIAIFIVAALTTSQAAAIAAIVPIGLTLGVPTQFLAAFSTACIGIYFFPDNGSQVASIATDETGTTKISKFAVWHPLSPSMFVMWGSVRPSSPCSSLLASWLSRWCFPASPMHTTPTASTAMCRSKRAIRPTTMSGCRSTAGASTTSSPTRPRPNGKAFVLGQAGTAAVQLTPVGDAKV